MADRLKKTTSWDTILLQPQPYWHSKSSPVVEETVIDSETGRIVEKKLARVSPVHQAFNKFPPYGFVEGTQVVSLEYEVESDGVNSSTRGVEVEELQAGGWYDDLAKQNHKIELHGFTQDKKNKSKKWSNTV